MIFQSIISSKYYQDSVDELMAIFKRLTIIADGIPCIRFADPEVKRICVKLWDTDKNGDINVSEAESYHTFNAADWVGTTIKTFDEMRLFTNSKQYNNQTFSNCTSLESIILPDSFVSVNYKDFSGCVSLKRIIIGRNVTKIDTQAFNGCTSLSTIVWGGSETQIREYGAFEFCAFEELELPDTIEYIGATAFKSNTKLKKITLGPKVNTLGGGALRDCPLLTTVIIEAATPPVCSNPADTFANSPCVVYVPDNVLNTYKTASGWIGFATKIKPISEQP